MSLSRIIVGSPLGLVTRCSHTDNHARYGFHFMGRTVDLTTKNHFHNICATTAPVGLSSQASHYWSPHGSHLCKSKDYFSPSAMCLALSSPMKVGMKLPDQHKLGFLYDSSMTDLQQHGFTLKFQRLTVLVPVLLLGEVIMTKAGYKRKHLMGLMVSGARVHGGALKARWQEQQRVHILICKQEPLKGTLRTQQDA